MIGSDPSYSQIVAFSIEQSDRVTAVSDSLRASTYAELGVARDIVVIPNFLDVSIHRRRPRPELRRRFTGGDEAVKLVIHVSNFRPVKRTEAVMRVFDRIRRARPARLLLVGDGPDLAAAHRTARQLGISGLVHGLGAQEEVVPLLSVSDVFLLPSSQESFGLAALESMACEVPVVASNVRRSARSDRKWRDRLPAGEMISTGWPAARVALLNDRAAGRSGALAACRRRGSTSASSAFVPMYEDCYRVGIRSIGPTDLMRARGIDGGASLNHEGHKGTKTHEVRSRPSCVCFVCFVLRGYGMFLHLTRQFFLNVASTQHSRPGR